jgi:hypothetical protein
VQIAKSFKAQSPPLPWVPIKQDLGDFYIAAVLRERGAAQRPLVELQWNFDDGGTGRIVSAKPSHLVVGSKDFRSFSDRASFWQWAPSETAQPRQLQTFYDQEREGLRCMTIA